MTKLKIWKWEEYPELSRQTQHNHRVHIRGNQERLVRQGGVMAEAEMRERERFEDAALLALKVYKGA